MKNFLYSIFLIILFIFVTAVIYLSTIGLETARFNSLVSKEVEKKDPKIELRLEKIKIKLDLKTFQLFLTTKNPKITYQDIKIPITEIKIYSKVSEILKSKININQIVFRIQKFKVKEIKKIAIRIKPSNFKTYLLNNLTKGEVEKALFDLNIDKDFKVTDYKMNGTIKEVNVKIKNNLVIKNLNFNFIIDKKLTLINSINANYDGILISNGSIDLQRKEDTEIKGKFNSQFNLNEKHVSKLLEKVRFFKDNKIKIKGSLIHEFSLKIDNSFKVIDYKYKSNGEIIKSKIILKKKFTKKLINQILFEKTKFEINLNKNNNNLLIFDGMYSTDASNYKKFKITNNLKKNNQNYLIDLDLSENFFLDIINFETNSQKKSNIKSEFSLKNNKFFFKSIEFTEDKNSILIKGLILNNKNEVEKITSINLLTFDKNKENNNLKINFGKKIHIFGKSYDSTFLLKLISSNTKFNPFKNFNNVIEIKLENLTTKSKISLKNFYLIGFIKKGKFNKISAKSDFSQGKHLDISMKTDLNNKKILEVYSDVPQALLGDYNFFEGIKEGKLLYKSIIDDNGSASKLTIENFKLVRAPSFAKLLTLADLNGFADLLSGQGMSFNVLEVNFQNNSKLTTIEEILALGTSVSLQMDGYVEKNTGLLSLSGTLVPAKNLNLLVSKIPLVGNILVGNKVGEGVFGVSFKMKGTPGKIKTTVNPLKTITPRFIIRALEKIKKE